MQQLERMMNWQHARRRPITAGLSLFAILLAAGCTTLPRVPPADSHTALASPALRIRGSGAPVNDAASDGAIAHRLPAHGQGSLQALINQENALLSAPLYGGNKVTLLEDGPATYTAMWQAIHNARDHIDLETYIFENAGFGRQLATLLLQKRAQGVKVHIIYDGMGSRSTPHTFFDRLRAGGIQLLEFNPLNPLKARTTWSLNDRDHRRILAIDGKVAFTGGINISSVYSRSSFGARRARIPFDPTKQAWRDTDIEIEGPAVAQFERLFLNTWVRKSGQVLADSRFFPPLPAQGHQLVRVVGGAPDIGEFDIYKAYINAIRHARKSVHITQAYFVPDNQFADALCQAAVRGVDVKLVLPSISDFDVVKSAARSYYQRLMAYGVKIYERKHVMLHAKTAVIDGVWSTVGSSNLDWRSFISNDEINVIVYGSAFGSRMEHTFAQDVADSQRIDPQQWSHRPLRQRVRDDAARVLKFLL